MRLSAAHADIAEFSVDEEKKLLRVATRGGEGPRLILQKPVSFFVSVVGIAFAHSALFPSPTPAAVSLFNAVRKQQKATPEVSASQVKGW